MPAVPAGRYAGDPWEGAQTFHVEISAGSGHDDG